MHYFCSRKIAPEAHSALSSTYSCHFTEGLRVDITQPNRRLAARQASQTNCLDYQRCIHPIWRVQFGPSPSGTTAGQAGLLPKRLSQQRQLLHPVLIQRTCCPTPCGLMPIGVSHKRRLLPGKQQRVKSRNRQKWQLPVWISHQWCLLFTQLRPMLCA